MKWVVASVGAVVVTAGVFLVVMLLPTVLFPVVYESLGGLIALYAVGGLLAIAAGVSSFRATLRHYAKKGQ